MFITLGVILNIHITVSHYSIKMSAFAPTRRLDHCAVYLDNCVIVFGGGLRHKHFKESPRVIWIYNLIYEEWRKQVDEWTKQVPKPFAKAAAAAIDKTIYVFGGYDESGHKSNAIWKLRKTKYEWFYWSEFYKPQCKEESPSPRAGHSGWEYAGNLWIFGGYGDSLEGYLNDNGHTEEFSSNSFSRCVRNNQLLCFDPNTECWTNPQCFGRIPTPRSSHANIIINNKVFLLGGINHEQGDLNDMFELTMNSLTWSQIQIAQSHPKPCPNCTLTAKTDDITRWSTGNHTITVTDTWITDHTSHIMEAAWRQFTSREDLQDHRQEYWTTGLNNRVLIIGGDKSCLDTCDMYNIFDAMLGLKSLQQVAMQAIVEHQNELPVNCLPGKLLSLMGLSVKD